MSLEDDARDWIAANWKGVDDLDYRNKVVEAGWAAPDWPVDAYGKGLSAAEARLVSKLFTAAGAPDPVRNKANFGALMGNPIVEKGSDALKRKVLPKLLNGEWERGCLLYSEPGNGSDLAGLQTKAERDGDEYVVNGQKIWTTGGHLAQMALLLARTNWDVPKHEGISLFVLDMKTPGIEVRPIKQMTGEQDFNEVFLTDVRVPAENIIGAENEGWKVLQIALKEERRMMGIELGRRDAQPGERPAIFSMSDDLIEAARSAGRLDDEAIRQEIMKNHSWRMVNQWNGTRAMRELQSSGGSSLASLGKLAKSRILHQGWALRFKLIGAKGLLYDPADKANYEVDNQLMWAFINSIGGGSDQIQRNIISERILGLPKGHEADRGIPFRDVRKGGTFTDEKK